MHECLHWWLYPHLLDVKHDGTWIWGSSGRRSQARDLEALLVVRCACVCVGVFACVRRCFADTVHRCWGHVFSRKNLWRRPSEFQHPVNCTHHKALELVTRFQRLTDQLSVGLTSLVSAKVGRLRFSKVPYCCSKVGTTRSRREWSSIRSPSLKEPQSNRDRCILFESEYVSTM